MNKGGGFSHQIIIQVCNALSLKTVTVKSICGSNSQEKSAPGAGKYKGPAIPALYVLTEGEEQEYFFSGRTF